MEALAIPAVEEKGIQLSGNDSKVIQMWLHRKAAKTQQEYIRDVQRFLEFAGVPLNRVDLRMLQEYADTLADRAPRGQNRTMAAIRSLFTFAHKMGYIPANPGVALENLKVKDTLAERILTENEVFRMITLEPATRNRVLLQALYYCGCRVSELCGLKWRDLRENGEGGQVTIFGKGGKTRVVNAPSLLWKNLADMRSGAGPDCPVFRSRNTGHLTAAQVWKIVRNAADRAGIESAVSPHWLRHANASHALDRGCPIHVVQATLGHASLATTTNYVHAKPQESSGMYLAG